MTDGNRLGKHARVSPTSDLVPAGEERPSDASSKMESSASPEATTDSQESPGFASAKGTESAPDSRAVHDPKRGPQPHQAPGSTSALRRPVLVAVLVVCLVVAVGGFVTLSGVLSAGERARERQEQTPVPETPTEEELPVNPIDFAAEQEKSADIYAWIYIPDTGVNLPIVQSSVDDNFYLRRDVTGADDVFGSIFTQSMNARDFSDPVTLVYGHDTDNGTMFGDLHKFEDKTFFDEHEDMYIYTPGHILTYRIVAAYVYDDRHIMNSFDFSDLAVRQRYFDSVMNPTSMVVNVRDGVTLTTDDKIVQLSTCNGVSTSDNTRYLVTGVLVDDQETK